MLVIKIKHDICLHGWSSMPHGTLIQTWKTHMFNTAVMQCHSSTKDVLGGRFQWMVQWALHTWSLLFYLHSNVISCNILEERSSIHWVTDLLVYPSKRKPNSNPPCSTREGCSGPQPNINIAMRLEMIFLPQFMPWALSLICTHMLCIKLGWR